MSQIKTKFVANNQITNAKLAQMATLTIKGNNTGGTANALDLTATQVTAILDAFTSSLQGLVPASGGGTTNFLRADGTWTAPTATLPVTTKGDLLGYSTVAARFPVGTDGQLVIADSNQTLGVRYQDPFPKNYILNSDAQVDTAGWAIYVDTAGNIPVDGTGGTATGLTFSRSTSSPLVGNASFSMVQTNSTNIQGKGISYDFTIDSAMQAKPLDIQFSYNASTTFVAANGITAPLNDGTTTTNAGNSDVEVFLYDVTNAILIPVSPQVIVANGANNFQFKGTFQTASNSTSYRLILHVATANANATGWTFKFDQMFLGAIPSCYGAAVTDWVSFTPTGSWTSNTTYTGAWRRVGDSMEIQVDLTLSGAPTSATLTINMPSGYAIDSTKIANTGTGLLQILGYAQARDSGAATYDGNVHYVDGTRVLIEGPGASATWTQAVPFTFGTADSISMFYQVPVAGWSSTVQMSNDTDTRVVAMEANSGSTSISSGATTTLVFSSVVFDTHGAYNSSTGVYTVPVSGFYKINTQTFSNANRSVTLNDVYILRMRQNGSIKANGFTTIQSTSSQQNGVSGNTILKCVAGDTIDIAFTNGSGATFAMLNDSNYDRLTIERLTGPASIAASESVVSVYTTNAGQSIPNATGTIINFEDKVVSTHDSVTTGASWKFTAPMAANYDIDAIVAFGSTTTFTTGELVSLSIRKNGSYILSDVFTFPTTGSADTFSFSVSGTVPALAGDYFDIIMDQFSGASLSLVASTLYNRVNIRKI